MAIQIYQTISESDLDKTVWRYLTFPKYISLLTYRALWFSKLNILTDQYEGYMPAIADAEMLAEFQEWKDKLDPSLHEQIDNMNKRNVEDGRELLVASCWFLADSDSERMWKEYANGSEGVAIKSTIRALSQFVFCDPRTSHIGKVQYVDLENYSMSHYQANQAHHRAFLKKLEYCHENELRIVTMNFKGPMCVNMDGTLLKPEEYQGANMNNFENRGLYIQADLTQLIKATVLAPGASTWFELLIKRLVLLSNVGSRVERSMLG
jgi:GTPase SAR1 family protein